KVLHDSKRWALFSLREDYVASLDPYLHLIPTRLETRFRMDLLGVEAARRAIRDSAKAEGVTFTDDATKALVDDLCRVRVQRPDGTTEEVRGPYVEPVQLQVVCHHLWRQLTPEQDLVEPNHIAALGDVDASLKRFYDETVAAVSGETNISQRRIRA